jgi:murein L,D-transpeptidase YcbB/YkuD
MRRKKKNMSANAVRIVLVAICGTLSLTARGDALWLQNGRISPQARAVMKAMESAGDYGLRPADYAIDPNTETLQSTDAASSERFAAALSTAASRFVRDLSSGRVDPKRAGFDLPAARHALNTEETLKRLATSNDVAATLASLEPTPAPYRRLKAALSSYRALATDAALTKLPPPPSRTLEAGDRYAGAPQLRRLLSALGDLAPDAMIGDDETVFDAALADAVRSFQSRHGLTVDGIVGPKTFAALTKPLTQRVEQIELSMERWRWLAQLEKPSIAVNIPQFMLFTLPSANEPGIEPLEMRVIVGETQQRSQTPVFTTSISQVVFQPYWDVPRSILLRELLPKIRKDIAYLDKQDMEIVRGNSDDARVVAPTPQAIEALAAGELRLRQRPGPKNSLGPIKFVMRNPYSVYLHATPQQALFERAQRTFSHGCVRVSEPRALASYVMRASGASTWDDAAIEAAFCRSDTLRVTLPRAVDVIIFYATAVATEQDGVLFFEDVYGHDRKLRALLATRR